MQIKMLQRRGINLGEIFEGSKLRKFNGGDIVFQPGEVADTVYLVEQGKVEIKYLDESGKKLILLVLAPGEIFGETCLFEAGAYRRHLAVAIENDTEVRMIDKENFENLMNLNPSILSFLLEELAKRVNEFEEKIEDLAFKDIQTRLAHQIIKLSDAYGKRTKDGIVIRLHITHRDLAEMVGAARENVTMAISNLVAEGFITNTHHRIIIKDKRSLSEKYSS